MNLYNKYRPATLQEIKGQEFVVNTLDNMLEQNSLPHTLLFTSSQGGTGKTSTARILSRALNAFSIEIDASSCNTVEVVRNLINHCQQKPIVFSNNFVIIDECFWKYTKVATLTGEKNICDIIPGDIVSSFPASNVVERVLKKKVDNSHLLWLEFNDGSTVLTTRTHKFCTLNGEWLSACELTTEHKLFELNCQTKYVVNSYSYFDMDRATLKKYLTRNEIKRGYTYLYDLTITSSHCYYINNVLVHNCSRYSKSTWDVFLKFIEQPPEFTYICFCTTDVDKIPSTIKSRCTHFVFQSLDTSTIQKQLAFICEKERKQYQLHALKLLSTYASGSMRQAISYLEYIFNQPEITVDVVTKHVIHATYTDMMNVTLAYLEDDTATLIYIINKVENIQKFIEYYFTFILDILIYYKTKDFALTSLPDMLHTDVSRLAAGMNRSQIERLSEELFHLQWEGKHSPILKELFLSRFI